MLSDVAKSVKQNLKIQQCKITFCFLIFRCLLRFFKWGGELLLISVLCVYIMDNRFVCSYLNML